MAQKALKNILNSTLDALDYVFEGDEVTIDQETPCFYVFKKYPLGLSKTETTKWTDLQQDLLSPFKEQHVYRFKSNEGIHLWYAKQPIIGAPETASQQTMEDGEHYLKSKTAVYKQTWKDGVMLSCLNLPKETNSTQFINCTKKGWAISSASSELLSSSPIWYKISFFSFGIFLLMVIAAWSTYAYQIISLNSSNEQLSEEIGPKLLKREQYSDTLQILETLTNWQTEFNHLPIALSFALNELNALASITVNRWQWQNKILLLEFSADNMNITKLVEQTQALDGVDRSNIRPHNDQNTWILEIQWK